MEKRKPNLILHAGGALATMAQIDEVITPQRTNTWVPIPHNRLIGTVTNALSNAGLTIGESSHALSHNGDRYFGLMEIHDRNEPNNDKEYTFVVGLRNSHDKTFPAGLVAGASVFVCDNLSFSAEVSFGRKHTVFINRDLPMLTMQAVGRLGDMRRKQDERFNAYKGFELDDKSAHDLMIRAVDCRATANQMVPKVIEEWRKPSHEEFAPRNMWSLFNCYTEALKGYSLAELPKRTQALHGLFDSYIGLN
tara:strand:- start:100 stop:849 length:750 start_codon:yes stop_codon:yes gene_type:complete